MNWFWRSRRDEEIDRLNKHIAFLQKHCEESHKEILAKIGEVFQRDLEIDQIKKNSAGLLEALESAVLRLEAYTESDMDMPASSMEVILYKAQEAIAHAKGIQS